MCMAMGSNVGKDGRRDPRELCSIKLPDVTFCIYHDEDDETQNDGQMS